MILLKYEKDSFCCLGFLMYARAATFGHHIILCVCVCGPSVNRRVIISRRVCGSRERGGGGGVRAIQ